MGKELKFTTAGMRGGFKKSETACRGCVIHNKVLEMDDIAEDFARYAKLDVHDAQYYAKFFVDYIVNAVANGYRLNMGAFSLYLTMKGTIQGANGPFDSARNKLELQIGGKKPIQDALASLEPVNVTMAGDVLRISGVMDETLRTEGVITLGTNVYAAGYTFLIDPSRDDEGVWLENGKGEAILRAEVVSSTSTTLDCIFRGSAEPGEYRFAISTRMGDPSRPTPAIARRKVVVKTA